MTIRPPSAEHEHHAAERRFWERQLSTARWLNFITAGGGAVALVGLLFLYLSIADAEDATMRANRAWLAPSFMMLNGPLESGGPADVAIHVQNVGREPATGVRYRIHDYTAQYIPHGPAGAAPYNAIASPNTTCEGSNPTPLTG
jgi:hypothetical protein